jgi:hypothetical protein
MRDLIIREIHTFAIYLMCSSCTFATEFIQPLLLLIAQSVYGHITGWTAGVRFPVGARDFSILQSVEIGSGSPPPQPPIQWAMGI